MADAVSKPCADKYAHPRWVPRWTAFVNRLHTHSLTLDCPACGAAITLTRDAVGAHGVTIHCEACEDHLQHRTPQSFLRDLEAAGVDLGGGA